MGRHWNLVADIGGSNARFAVADPETLALLEIRHYRVSDYPLFSDVLRQFLADISSRHDVAAGPRRACLAVASPVDGNVLKLTNNHWTVDREEISALINNADVELINDFVAVGHGIASLQPSNWHQIGGRDPVAGRPIAVLGPGTGLGTCTVVPVPGGFQVLEGEGGHVDFAPLDDREIDLLKKLRGHFGRVSVERLLSGSGIASIHEALGFIAGRETHAADPSWITEEALAAPDSLCGETLAMFCAILGSVAGDMALTLGAKGGVYIAGGIVPRFTGFLEKSRFRSRFEAKGRFSSYVKDIPVRVITRANLGLAGAANWLDSGGSHLSRSTR